MTPTCRIRDDEGTLCQRHAVGFFTAHDGDEVNACARHAVDDEGDAPFTHYDLTHPCGVAVPGFALTTGPTSGEDLRGEGDEVWRPATGLDLTGRIPYAYTEEVQGRTLALFIIVDDERCFEVTYAFDVATWVAQDAEVVRARFR